MTEIIVTDLTRFSNGNIVCTAGIDISTGKCIRPMPYIPTTECKRLKILPGAILSGEFHPTLNRSGPHQEDMDHKNLSFQGPSSSNVFKIALESGISKTVEEGFSIKLSEKQKHIPLNHNLHKSIITIKVDPSTIKVLEDPFKEGKLKLNFMDQSGRWFYYLSITDLGFHNYAVNKFRVNSLDELNSFVNSQQEAYLRIGIGRLWNNGSIEGYWMQVNGIYTFPSFLEELRSYK